MRMVVFHPVTHGRLKAEELQQQVGTHLVRMTWTWEVSAVEGMFFMTCMAHLGGNVDHVQCCKQARGNHDALAIA